MYALAKFQPHIPKSFKVTALQSNSNRKIDLCSKYREINYRCLQKLTNAMMYRVAIYSIMLAMNRRIQ